MQWEFAHRVEYSADAQSVDDVVATLLAQKKLIEEGAQVLCATAGIDLDRVDVRVVNIASGSLFTELVIQLYTAYQTEIEDVIVEKVEAVTGYDIPEGWEPIVTLAALAVAYFIMRFVYDAVRNRKQNDRPISTHIEGDYNKVINIIASKVDCSVEELEGALKGRLPRSRRRSLIKHVSGFLNPARKERGSDINVDGFGRIRSEVIAEYPSDSEIELIDESRNVDLPNVEIEIRATDRDRTKTGWAARVLDHKDFVRRLPMDLYPTVDAERLAKFDRVKADIIMEGEYNDDGMFLPKRIHLLDFEDTGDGAKPREE